MAIGRKGVFYMFFAFIVLGILGLLVVLMQSPGFSSTNSAVNARVNTIDDFIRDLNNDAQKATYIAAYRSLIVLEEEIALEGEYFGNVTPAFEEVFFNGTLNGQNKTLMNTSSFTDYLNRVKMEASDIGVNLDVEIKGVEIYHKDPWRVTVDITFQNNLTDKNGVASWSYEKTQRALVPLANLRDPVYTVGTLGRVPNTIQKTNVSYFVYDVADANDTTNLMIHANNTFYIANPLAPSYLMRLEGNFSASDYGIESLVNIPDLENQDLEVNDNRSIVDYVYFNNNLTNASPVCDTIINTPSWFQIDEDHLEDYEISTKLDPEGGGYECP